MWKKAFITHSTTSSVFSLQWMRHSSQSVLGPTDDLGCCSHCWPPAGPRLLVSLLLSLWSSHSTHLSNSPLLIRAIYVCPSLSRFVFSWCLDFPNLGTILRSQWGEMFSLFVFVLFLQKRGLKHPEFFALWAVKRLMGCSKLLRFWTISCF